MLKTSESTESTTRPGKGRVGVGGNGSDNGDHVDGGSRNGDSDRNSSDAPKMMCLPAPCTSRLRTSTSLDLSINATKIVVDFDGVDSRSGDFDVTFQVTRWRSKHCSYKRAVAFNCVSEADHEKPIRIALNWGSIFLVDVSILTGEGSLSRVDRVHRKRPWPGPKLVQVIQMFFRLLSTFLPMPLISMLSTSWSTRLIY